MEIHSYTKARQNLARLMDEAGKGGRVVIHRQGAKPVIMIALEDFEAMDETGYLLSSPANARRLQEAHEQFEKGDGMVFNSLDDMKRAFDAPKQKAAKKARTKSVKKK